MTTGPPLHGQDIRLLVLGPAREDSRQLSYHLVRTSIDQAPPYEALSYAWGKAYCQVKLKSDLLVTMTTNLYEALIYLRLPSAPRMLWVDAICIDQMNDSERVY